MKIIQDTCDPLERVETVTNDDAYTEAKFPEDAGNAALQKADYQGALDFFYKAQEKYRQIGDGQKEADQWNKIAHCLLNTNKPDEALEAMEATIRLLQKTRNRTSQAKALNNMGLLNSRLKRFDNALTCFQDALDLFDLLGNKFGMATQLGNIGTVYRDQAAHKKALDFYFDAISIFEEIGAKPGRADQSANIGCAYAMDDKPEEALKWFHKALLLYEELKKADLAKQTRQNIVNLTAGRT